jgi:hypothetical protein
MKDNMKMAKGKVKDHINMEMVFIFYEKIII